MKDTGSAPSRVSKRMNRRGLVVSDAPSPTPEASAEDDDKGSLPALTLIFTTDDKQRADWERLLDLADVAYGAIEFEDPRFHILKSFTFYAGAEYQSQADTITSLRAALTEERERRMDLQRAHDELVIEFQSHRCGGQ